MSTHSALLFPLIGRSHQGIPCYKLKYSNTTPDILALNYSDKELQDSQAGVARKFNFIPLHFCAVSTQEVMWVKRLFSLF
jgi:hypothetical protein